MAHDPDDVRLGGANVTASITSITNSSNTNPVLELTNTAGGVGLLASTDSEFGVSATANSASAIYGDSQQRAGIEGHSISYTGVFGQSTINVPNPPAKTGVFGFSDWDGTSVGVHGESTDGIGVLGLATGSGVAAFGLFARSNSSGAGAIGARSAGNATAVMAKSGTGSFPAAKAKTAVYGYAAQDSSAKGLWGETTTGHAIHGTATSGYAGYFVGKVYTTKFHEMQEIGTPAAPVGNRVRLFARDNGSGKTQLCVSFSSGAVHIIATQP